MDDELPALAETAHVVASAPPAIDFEAIVWRVFNLECTNSPYFQGPNAADIVTQNFLPALIAALKKG